MKQQPFLVRGVIGAVLTVGYNHETKYELEKKARRKMYYLHKVRRLDIYYYKYNNIAERNFRFDVIYRRAFLELTK